MDREITNVMHLVLSKLIRMRKWGGAHTEITNLTKGLPFHYRSSQKGKKIIQKAIKELVKREFLLLKQSTLETHVSLNPRKTKEIRDFLNFLNKNIK